MSERVITYHGVKLHSGQKRILQHIQNNPQAKFITIKTSRQWGKSLFAMQLLLSHCLNEKKMNIAWFAPYIAQAKKVMKQLYEAVQSSGLIFDYNQTDRIITFVTGSKVQFFGVDNSDGIRGNTFDYAVCDEAAYYPQDVFETVIRPTLLVKGKKCYIISTPRGKKNWFYKYYMQTSTSTTIYANCEGNYLENVYIDKEEVEAARLLLPDHIFRQEYLGEFLDSEFQVFLDTDKCATQTTFAAPTSINFIGIDLGRKQDYTVMYVINELGQTVEIYRDNNKLWQTLVNQLVTRLRKYNAVAVVDSTGVGDAVAEQIKTQYRHIVPFVITGTGEGSKQNIIEQLIISMQNEELKLPTKELYSELHNELEAFECVYTPHSRSIKYQAMSGFHDDIVLALSLANECRKKRYKPSGNFNIKRI